MMRVSDALCVVGIGMIGYGLWLVHPSLMWTGIGSAIVYLGALRHSVLSERTKQESKK